MSENGKKSVHGYDFDTILQIRDLNAYYGEHRALNTINVDIPERQVTAIMGPSGCGKSTFIRCLNLMHELIDGAWVEGDITFRDQDFFAMDPRDIRRKIGMVFQKPNPFPTMSIYDNTVAGYKLVGEKKRKSEFDDIVEENLTKVGLWDEVKDKLKQPGTSLSGGQQQRLCIARTVAVKPEVILFDEPTSALDPIATSKIEQLIYQLKQDYTIVIVTHNMQQASRVSDYSAFFMLGDLIEFGDTETIFINPKHQKTNEYLTGKFS